MKLFANFDNMKRMISLALLLLSAFASEAQDATVDKIIELGKNDNRVMRHADFLANRIGGRPVGSDALTDAERWVAGQFESWGLEVMVQEVGRMAVGFNRGPAYGRMLSEDGKDCINRAYLNTLTTADSPSEASSSEVFRDSSAAFSLMARRAFPKATIPRGEAHEATMDAVHSSATKVTSVPSMPAVRTMASSWACFTTYDASPGCCPADLRTSVSREGVERRTTGRPCWSSSYFFSR